MLGGSDSQLIVEAVMPDSGHVVPVGDDTVFDGIPELEDTLFGLSLFADVALLIVQSNHDGAVLGFTDNAGEASSGGIVSGHTSLAHT